jgi:hypothetical protein
MLSVRRAAGFAAPLSFLSSLLVLALVAPAPAEAQRVSGVVAMPGGAAGAGGFLVVAKDSAGTEVVRAVTSEEGRFALPLPRAGAYRVELWRVGFAPMLLVEKQFAGGETLTLEPTASATITSFPLRGAGTPNSCSESPESRAYVAAVMEEARTALLAIQLGVARQGVSARWAATDHRLAANGSDTARFSIARKQGNLLAAFGTPVLGDLQRSGYVVIAGKDRIFRGLDLGALLSPWFQEAYCFTAHEGSPSTLTVSFSPKERKRDYVDITGVITFSRATLELLGIEYLYQGLSQDEENRLGGGKMSFARSTGGSWLVADWSIRFPQVGYIELETFRSQDRARLLQPEVIGHELIAWHTTALLEGNRRVYVRDALATELPDGPIRSACTERVVTTPTGAARGRLTVDGRPVSGSRVRATWRVALDIGGEVPLWRDEIRETVSTNRGDWVLCDLPPNTTVDLSWEVMGKRSSASLRVPRDEIVTVGADGTVQR